MQNNNPLINFKEIVDNEFSIRWVLYAYLVIRIGIVNLVYIIKGDDINVAYVYVLELCVFLLGLLLIWMFRFDLKKANIDTASMIIILLFTILFQTSFSRSSSFFWIYYSVTTIAVLLLSIILWKNKHIPLQTPKIGLWLLISILSTILLRIFIFFVYRFVQLPDLTLVNAPLSVFLLQFRHAMGHSAIIEEPVFRGVLWGYLRKKGWRDQRIFWLQAGLFWIAHVRYYSKPQIFLITMPLGALLFGWLAWKSKTLAGSLLAHGLFNASSIFFYVNIP